MVKRNVTNNKNEGLVEDPHELLLSLVDMGSLDADECLLACVTEMSDAECKRVLNSLSLPDCCGMDGEECDDDADVEPMDDVVIEPDADDDETVDFPEDEDETADEAEEADESDDEDAELEARIRRLEKGLRAESMNRNRIRRFPRRKTNR